MKLTRASSAAAAGELAAQSMAAVLARAIDARGRATMALSGGSSPVPMLKSLAAQAVRWDRVLVFQVDERQVPLGSTDRNWAMTQQTFMQSTTAVGRPLSIAPQSGARVRAMLRLSDAARLAAVAGDPPQLDVVHLGLGSDGHTASWPPGHAVLDSSDAVAEVRDFNGHDRVTLTPSVINSARHVVWFIVGDSKREMLARLVMADPAIPAARVSPRRSEVFTDIELIEG